MLEQEVKAYCVKKGIRLSDRTRSHHELDFALPDAGIFFDVKEKLQPFSKAHWPSAAKAQEHLFIIDDLAVRKMLLHAPKSFCLIKDSSLAPPVYYLYSIVDLLCIPKVRARRPIERNVKAYKGKWLVDLRDAAAFVSLDDAMQYMLAYEKKFRSIFQEHIDCWGRYPSERLIESGTTRHAEHWKKDARSHL
jgi:hypothetical protein